MLLMSPKKHPNSSFLTPKVGLIDSAAIFFCFAKYPRYHNRAGEKDILLKLSKHFLVMSLSNLPATMMNEYLGPYEARFFSPAAQPYADDRLARSST